MLRPIVRVLAGTIVTLVLVVEAVVVQAQAAPSARSGPVAIRSASASAAPAKTLEFAVASIKPDKSGSRFMRLWFGEQLTATNVPLRLIIREAFNVASDDQITGEPDWTAGSRFDIEAKVDDADVATMKNLSFDQRREMVRQLLVERFGLKFHEETKDLRVYALVIGKDGPKLHPARPGDTYPNGFRSPDGKSSGGFMMNPNGQLVAPAVLMSDLARILSRQMGRTVIDKTGLTDKYDFTLQMPPVPSPMAMPSPGGASDPGTDGATSDDTTPSIFTDVEQLGLRLESQKALLPVFVIDHIEQPSAN